MGGWLSQCIYEKEHYDTFITAKDIKIIASWGVDHVRLPIDYEVINGIELNGTSEGLRFIENCISWCKNYHLNRRIKGFGDF